MTSDDILNRLIQFAENGRGLWIGMPAQRSPQHEIVKLEVAKLNEGVINTEEIVKQTASNAESHVTLIHLGQKNGRREVEAAITVCQVFSEVLQFESVSVECLARFDRHVVAILAPTWITRTSELIRNGLTDRHVYEERVFAGVPHVTIAPVLGDRNVSLPRIPKYSLTFAEILVACGKQEMRLPLRKDEIVF